MIKLVSHGRRLLRAGDVAKYHNRGQADPQADDYTGNWTVPGRGEIRVDGQGVHRGHRAEDSYARRGARVLRTELRTREMAVSLHAEEDDGAAYLVAEEELDVSGDGGGAGIVEQSRARSVRCRKVVARGSPDVRYVMVYSRMALYLGIRLFENSGSAAPSPPRA